MAVLLAMESRLSQLDVEDDDEEEGEWVMTDSREVDEVGLNHRKKEKRPLLRLLEPVRWSSWFIVCRPNAAA